MDIVEEKEIKILIEESEQIVKQRVRDRKKQRETWRRKKGERKKNEKRMIGKDKEGEKKKETHRDRIEIIEKENKEKER